MRRLVAPASPSRREVVTMRRGWVCDVLMRRGTFDGYCIAEDLLPRLAAA